MFDKGAGTNSYEYQQENLDSVKYFVSYKWLPKHSALQFCIFHVKNKPKKLNSNKSS